jgi:hypothetical protein
MGFFEGYRFPQSDRHLLPMLVRGCAFAETPKQKHNGGRFGAINASAVCDLSSVLHNPWARCEKGVEHGRLRTCYL